MGSFLLSLGCGTVCTALWAVLPGWPVSLVLIFAGLLLLVALSTWIFYPWGPALIILIFLGGHLFI